MVLERFAKSGARVAGTGAGSFLGGLANNPAFIIIAVILGGLLIFRGRISEAFAGFGENLGKVELPSLPQLPSFNIQFPDITFPSITFPSFEFPSFSFPEFPRLPSLQTPQQQLELFGQILTEQQESIIEQIQGIIGAGGGAEEIAPIIAEMEGGTSSLFEFNPPNIVGFGVLGEDLGGISTTLAGQLGITPETTFQEAINLVSLFEGGGFSAVLGAAQDVDPTIIVDPSISGEFEGGGPSFEGGFIFVTPTNEFA